MDKVISDIFTRSIEIKSGTVESSYSDHVCPGQIDHYKRLITITEMFSFFSFFMQITSQLTFVYLIHEYKVMKRTALLFTGFYYSKLIEKYVH